MNIVSAHFKGFKTATRFPRMILLMYLLNLFLALVVALPFFDILNNNAGNSLVIGQLLKGFDFSVFQNILSHSKDAFSTLIAQIKWVGILYLILNVFLVGGIYEVASSKKFSVSTFFGGCGRSFFRMLFLSFLVLVAHIILLAIFMVPVSEFSEFIFNPSYNEDTRYILIAVLVGVYALFFSMLLMISDYAKSYLVANNSINFLNAFFKGNGFVFRHFFKTITLYFLLILLPVAFFVLYFYVDGKVEFESKYMIWFTLAFQQIFIITRVWFRVWVLAAQYEMYVDDSEKDKIRRIERKKKKQMKMQQKAVIQKETKAKKKIEKQTNEKIEKIEKAAEVKKQEIENKSEEEIELIDSDFEKEQQRLEELAAEREAEINKNKNDDLLEFG